MSRRKAWTAIAALALACGTAAASFDPSRESGSNDGALAPASAQARPSCESPAGKWFKEHYPQPDEHTKLGSANATYRSHFSVAKGGCFLEVIATARVSEKAATGAGDTEMHHLVDLQTGQEIGQLVIVSNTTAPFVICELGDARCSNAFGWNALIAPYMNESGVDDRPSLLRKIKKCVGGAGGEDTGNRSSCWMPNAAAALSGITQAEIISVLGPPTWCQAPDRVVTHNKEACSANEVAGWSFPPAPPINQVGGGIELVCDPGKTTSCGRVYWVANQ